MYNKTFIEWVFRDIQNIKSVSSPRPYHKNLIRQFITFRLFVIEEIADKSWSGGDRSLISWKPTYPLVSSIKRTSFLSPWELILEVSMVFFLNTSFICTVMSSHLAQALDKLEIKELSHFLQSVSPENGYCWPHEAKENAFQFSGIRTHDQRNPTKIIRSFL